MGGTKPASVGGLQKGDYVVMEGVACKVMDVQTSKTGKHGHAKVRFSGIGLIDQKKRVVVLPAHDNCDVPIIEKKGAQVLSINGDTANVMNETSFETFDLAIPEELKGKVVSGCAIVYWEILDQKVMKQIKGA
jgi:translation initiation factor 5A